MNESRMGEAEEAFNRAIKIRPTDFKGVYNRGKLRLKQREIEAAIADFDKATTLKPEHGRSKVGLTLYLKVVKQEILMRKQHLILYTWNYQS